MNNVLSLIWTLSLALAFFMASSQTVIITDDPEYDKGASSAVLDVNSEQAGFLMPRMTKAQREAITEPARGLILFQTDEIPGFYYNAGSSEDPMWVILTANSGAFHEGTCGGTIWDVDGNRYPTVYIGNDLWMAENLRVTKFQNGEPIVKVQTASVWNSTDLAAYSFYDNMYANSATFGLLYNGIVISHPSGICPDGWMVPDDSHWQSMADYLGGAETAGQFLKAAKYWNTITPNAFNSSGFSALPSGLRSADDGAYSSLRTLGGWWSFINDSRSSLSVFMLDAGNDELTSHPAQPNEGYAIRCVKIKH